MNSSSGNNPDIGIHSRELIAFRVISAALFIALGLSLFIEFARKFYLYYEVYFVPPGHSRRGLGALGVFSLTVAFICFYYVSSYAFAGVSARAVAVLCCFLMIAAPTYFIGTTGKVESHLEVRKITEIDLALRKHGKSDSSPNSTKNIQYLRQLKENREEWLAVKDYWVPSTYSWIVLLVILPAAALWFLSVGIRAPRDLYWLIDPNKL